MEYFKKFIEKNALQLSIQIVGVLVLTLNTWLALKLVPLAERVLVLEGKVEAIENRSDQNLPLIERFIVVEEKTNAILERHHGLDVKIDKLNEKVNEILRQL